MQKLTKNSLFRGAFSFLKVKKYKHFTCVFKEAEISPIGKDNLKKEIKLWETQILKIHSPVNL